MRQLLETTPPRGTSDPHEEKETRGFAKALLRTHSGLRVACLRENPVDSSRAVECWVYKVYEPVRCNLNEYVETTDLFLPGTFDVLPGGILLANFWLEFLFSDFEIRIS